MAEQDQSLTSKKSESSNISKFGIVSNKSGQIDIS